MKLEVVIAVITIFCIFNAYYDGKYTKILMQWKKYYQMFFYALLGLGIYIMMKKNPDDYKNMLLNANNMVKYLPIDRSTIDMLGPVIDFTTKGGGGGGDGFGGYTGNFMTEYTNQSQLQGEKRILQSGKTTTKRSVSETKKKYVAAQQNWKCGNCNNQLSAWFEVDHKTRLADEGTNDVSNLIALCRECHGKKTAMENM